jgi:hypothetical protein
MQSSHAGFAILELMSEDILVSHDIGLLLTLLEAEKSTGAAICWWASTGDGSRLLRNGRDINAASDLLILTAVQVAK